MRGEFINCQYEHERHAEQFVRCASSLAMEYPELVVVLRNETETVLNNFPHAYDILMFEHNWDALQELILDDYLTDVESADQTRIGADIYGNNDWLVNQVTKQLDHQAGFLEGYRDTDTGLISNREQVDDLLFTALGFSSEHIAVREYVRRLRYVFVQ